MPTAAARPSVRPSARSPSRRPAVSRVPPAPAATLAHEGHPKEGATPSFRRRRPGGKGKEKEEGGRAREREEAKRRRRGKKSCSASTDGHGARELLHPLLPCHRSPGVVEEALLLTLSAAEATNLRKEGKPLLLLLQEKTEEEEQDGLLSSSSEGRSKEEEGRKAGGIGSSQQLFPLSVDTQGVVGSSFF